MWTLCIGFVSLLALSYAQKSINFTPCSDNSISEVIVNPCSTDPCQIPRGSTVSMQVFTKSNQDSQKLKLSIKADILGTSVKFPGLREDACKGYGITCPLKTGDDVAFKFNLKVLEFYPTIQTNATVEVTGESGKLFCFVSTVQLV